VKNVTSMSILFEKYHKYIDFVCPSVGQERPISYHISKETYIRSKRDLYHTKKRPISYEEKSYGICEKCVKRFCMSLGLSKETCMTVKRDLYDRYDCIILDVKVSFDMVCQKSPI